MRRDTLATGGFMKLWATCLRRRTRHRCQSRRYARHRQIRRWSVPGAGQLRQEDTMTHPLARPQRAAAVALLLLVTLACSDGTIGGPPTFAIRNFSTEKGDYSYTSRGTLIALDDGLKDGSYVVTLQYREKGETV